MIRFDPEESSEMSEEKRFYYLRLMAKPGGKPIKTKFVTWSRDDEDPQASVHNDQQLESQAMRVVRTIGQAFEVCHKVAQEQMQERHEDEAAKFKEEESGMLDVIEEKGAKEENSRSASPMEAPAVGGPLYGKRLSLFQPRKVSTGSSSAGTAIDTTMLHVEAQEVANPNPILPPKAPELVPQLQPQTAIPYNQKPQGSSSMPMGFQQPQQYNTLPSHMPGSAATISEAQMAQQPRLMQMPNMPYSATLPHSRTWASSQVPSYPQSIQSLEQPIPMYYPMPGMLPSSSSLPFGLSSPVMVSPYATLQLSMPPQLDPNDPAAISLEQYNQHLMRSQLDQAQQSAQVAGCQVQLLRDQLTSETTARLEAQSRTHQLLSANRDLLEQVQNLVQRLQMLETKITSEIHQSTTSPRAHPMQSMGKSSLPPYEQKDHRVPAGMTIKPNFPYQVQPLADLRAGSLPPVKESREKRKDDGTRTEPESNNDDTTDYSSSDQYEKTSNIRPTNLNILMSNPLVDINVSSSALPMRFAIDREDLEEQQPTSSTPPKKERRGTSGILRGEKDFSRMSFNPRLRDRDLLEDAEEGSSPDSVRRKMDEDARRASPQRKEKITVESLFKTSDVEPHVVEKEPPRKHTSFATIPMIPGMPASSSVVTAMYPPVRQPLIAAISKPKLDVVKKKTLRTLSVDIAEEPTHATSDCNSNSRNLSIGSRRKEDIEIKEIEDYINRNVDRSKLPETSLLARLTRQAVDPSLSNLPNGYSNIQ